MEHKLVRKSKKKLKCKDKNHFLYWFVICVGIGFFVFLAGFLGLLFLLWNGVNDSKVLNSRVMSSIDSFLGPEYETRLGAVEIKLQDGVLLTASSNVKIHKSGVPEPVVTIGKVLVEASLLSIFYDRPKISSITMESATVNLKQFQFMNQTSGFPVMPANMDESLGKFGNELIKLQERLAEGKFKRMVIKNVVFTGYHPSASRLEETLVINEFIFLSGYFGKLTMKLDMNAGEAKLNVNANYRKYLNGSSALAVNFDGLNANKWIKNIGIKNSFLASGSKMKGYLNLAFSQDGSARQPIAVIQLHDNGPDTDDKTDNVKIRHAVLNFRMFPELNRIALERSQIATKKFQMLLTGAITPIDAESGLSGDLRGSLQIEHFPKKRRKQGSGLLTMEGGFNQSLRQLNIRQWKLSTVEGNMTGVASIGFGSETPSFEFIAKTSDLSISGFKPLWPTFMENSIREWTLENMHSGRITSALIFISDPPSILEWLSGKKSVVDNGQLVVDMRISDATFNVFGELPPIREAYGRVQIDGKRLKVTLDKGNIYTEKDERIKIEKGKFTVPDILQLPARASFIAHGQISSLAKIANTPPFSVMKQLNMKPEQWSGQGEVDMVIDFPLKDEINYSETIWHALMRLEKAESSKSVTGRKISRADVVIDAGSDTVVITGDVAIDDIFGSVFMIKSIGKNSKAKNRTTFKTRLDSKELNRFNVNIQPVISGPMDIELESHGNNSYANIKVDLRDAEISFPWIDWRKGAGVQARASFQIDMDGELKNINNLKMMGQGFSLDGNLVLDKKGLRSFEIARISLNEGDDLAASIYRDQQAYVVKVDGAYFDGRALINKLFHQKRGTDRQEESTFKLSARVKQIKGFNKRDVNNLVLDCSIDKGWLDTMNMEINPDSSKKITVNANTKEKITDLEIYSQDAGNILSFLNLYTRMVNGEMKSNLKRKRDSPFSGTATVENFVIVDEPRFKRLTLSKQLDNYDRDGKIKKEFSKMKTNKVRFSKAESSIEVEPGYLKLNGFLVGPQIGLTYDGILYDRQNQININGTFMPAFTLSKMVSVIPFVNQILSNGQDSGLIGINYHLSGPVDSPRLQLNPLSIVAPGIFKKIFQQQNAPKRK